MNAIPADGSERFHFMGIGGAGMSALAEILIARGYAVSGCDVRSGGVLDRMQKLGASVAVGHDPGHLEEDVTVVVSSAIGPSNPELAAARERGIGVVRRAELLAEILGESSVAVAGTHGKSTTTTMVGAVMTAAGLDPTVVVGGRIRGLPGNVRIGAGRWTVAEADEFDRSFLALDPTHAVITNVEADHLDTYATLEEIRRAFAEFIERIEPGGTLVRCIDDPGARGLPTPAGVETVGYGMSEDAAVRAADIRPDGLVSRFDLIVDGDEVASVALAMPGVHNVLNALGAAAVARALALDWSAVADGLGTVRGVERRFEIVHADADVTIVDDYAHHPTEVAATLASTRSAWPRRRLVAVFQPHLYTRTRDFGSAFGAALAGADVVFVTEVYPAREEPIEGVTGEVVTAAARAAGAEDVTFVPDVADESAVARRIRPGDVIVTMGAGDVDRMARRLAAIRVASGTGAAGGEEER